MTNQTLTFANAAVPDEVKARLPDADTFKSTASHQSITPTPKPANATSINY